MGIRVVTRVVRRDQMCTRQNIVRASLPSYHRKAFSFEPAGPPIDRHLPENCLWKIMAYFFLRYAR